MATTTIKIATQRTSMKEVLEVLRRALPEGYAGDDHIVCTGVRHDIRWYIVAGHRCPLAYIVAPKHAELWGHVEETYLKQTRDGLPSLEGTDLWYHGFDYAHNGDFDIGLIKYADDRDTHYLDGNIYSDTRVQHDIESAINKWLGYAPKKEEDEE